LFLIIPLPPRSSLFPYTTLFRSRSARHFGAPRSRDCHLADDTLHTRRRHESGDLDRRCAIACLYDRQRYYARSAAASDSWRLDRSEEHTSELQSLAYLVCRLLLE